MTARLSPQPEPVPCPEGLQSDTLGSTASEQTPLPISPLPPVRARRARRARRGRWGALLLALAGVALLAATGLFLWRPAPRPSVSPDGRPDQVESRPREVTSLLDALDQAKIPAEERFDWYPKELVGILGSLRCRHPNRVYQMALSPDEKYLASCGNADGVRLWDARTGKLLALLQEGDLFACAFSPDSKTLAFGGTGILVLWDIAAGKKKADLSGPAVKVTHLAFSSTGKLLASCYWGETTLRLWDLTTLKEAGQLAHNNPVRLAEFAPDGKTLAVGTMNANWAYAGGIEPVEVVLWDVTTQTRTDTLVGHNGFTSLAYSPDGKLLATGGHSDRKVILWDASTRRKITTLPQPQSVHALAFTPDSKSLAAGHEDLIELWDVAGKLRKPPALRTPGKCNHLLFTNGGRTLLSNAYEEGIVHTWDLADGKRKTPVGPYGAERLVLAPDGRSLAVGGRDRVVHVWDLSTLAVRPYPFHGSVKDLAFAPDRRTLAVRAESRTLLLNLADGKSTAGTETIGSVAISPDGKVLAVAGETEIQRWPLLSHSRPASLPLTFPFPIPYRKLVFAPNSRSLAAAVATWSNQPGGEVLLFNLGSGQPRSLDGQLRTSAASLTFAPDGETLVWWADGVLWFWDVESGKDRIGIPLAPTRSTAFSPDGKLLAALASPPGKDELVLIATANGAVLHRIALRKELAATLECVFAPDGRHLFLASGTGAVFVLRLPSLTLPTTSAPSWEPIARWRLLGPFPRLAGSVNPPFAVQTRDGALEESDFLKTYPASAGQMVGWTSATAFRSGLVNLISRWGKLESVGAFGYAVIPSEQEREVQLLLGSDDTLTVWLNGKQVFDMQKTRAWCAAEDSVTVRLRKGDNHLLVRCMNGGGEWGFSVHVQARK